MVPREDGNRRRIPEPVREALKLGFSVVPQLANKSAFFPWKEYQQRAPTNDEVTRWHREHPRALWALVTGQVSKRVVFDFDGDDGLTTLRRLKLKPTILTPHDGAHVWCEAPGWAVQGGARVDPEKFPGLDLRSDGQLATFYGRTKDGLYRPAEARVLYGVGELPDALQELLVDRERRPPDPHVHVPDDFADFLEEKALLSEAVERVKERHPRNETGFWLACQARDERISFDDAVTLAHRFADLVASNGSHSYTYQEAYDSVMSAYSAPPRAPRNLAAARAGDGFMATDYGNAERLVARHGEDIRYCHPWRSWLVWDERRWQQDATAEIYRRAKRTIRSVRTVASKLEDKKTRAALLSWATKSEDSKRINGMIRLAESEPSVPVLPDDLDSDSEMLNLGNGTYRLDKGLLVPHRREDMLTKLAPVKYDDEADARRWDKFLRQIVPNEDDRRFLQRAIGYSLTADTAEQVLFFLYGTGANGKSTFLETIAAVLGDYAQQAPPDLLLSRRSSGSATPEVARLRGARFVTTIETEEGRHLSESLVKQLTGNDRVAARFLYRDLFEFTPVAKFWLATNHKPEIRGTDEAIWRRIRLIPFTVQIPASKRDSRLRRKLAEELPGILNWALDGLAAWREQGLAPTANITAATSEYRSEQDSFGAFLEDSCVIGDGEQAAAEALFDAYQDWCGTNNVRLPMTQQSFGRKLSERGFQRVRGPKRRWVWRGVGSPKARSAPRVRGVR